MSITSIQRPLTHSQSTEAHLLGSIFLIGTTGLRGETLSWSRSGGDVLAPPFLPSRCSESQCPGPHCASLGGASKGSPSWWQTCSWHGEGQERLELPLLVVAAARGCGSLHVPSLLVVMRRRTGSFLWRDSVLQLKSRISGVGDLAQ